MSIIITFSGREFLIFVSDKFSYEFLGSLFDIDGITTMETEDFLVISGMIDQDNYIRTNIAFLIRQAAKEKLKIPDKDINVGFC